MHSHTHIHHSHAHIPYVDHVFTLLFILSFFSYVHAVLHYFIIIVIFFEFVELWEALMLMFSGV